MTIDDEIQDRPDELRRELVELRASRARLVAAADAERRRIERELHDGVQQRLVALSVNLQLARRLSESNPAEAEVLLQDLSADLRAALADVQALGERVYPPLLEAQGLVEALRSVAGHAKIPTIVEAADLARYPTELEAAIYFCCREALENVAAHAGAGARATIRLGRKAAALTFEIEGDRIGLDQGLRPPGEGLTPVRDRVEALGGRLEVVSSTGGDTRISGEIPLAP